METHRSSRLESIDLIKGIACIAVCLIHIRMPKYGDIIASCCKWAVPFFFIISGYYCYRDSNLNFDAKRFKQKIVNVLRIVLFAVVFYTIFHILVSIFILHIPLDLANHFTCINIIKFFLENTPFYYTHLWFLFSLIYCYLSLYAIGCKVSGRWKYLFVFIALMFFSIVNEFVPIIKGYFRYDFFVIYNSFLIRALPFVLIGVIIRECQDKISLSWLKWWYVIPFFFTSILEFVLAGEMQFYISSYLISGNYSVIMPRH